MRNRRRIPGAVFFMPVLIAGFVLLGHSASALTAGAIYRKASPGVVFIVAFQDSQAGRAGTGSIIREDGLVITSAHILVPRNSSAPASKISVFLKPRQITGNYKRDLSRGYRGRVLAYDLPLDLALVRIIGVEEPLVALRFGDSDRVSIGDQAYAIGHPEQGGLWSLTTGVISARIDGFGGIAGKNLFQTEASINRGNSGGPLLDREGRIIGVNSMIARQAADGTVITDVNFSIRSKVVLGWLDRLGYPVAAAAPTRSSEEQGETSSVPHRDGEASEQPSGPRSREKPPCKAEGETKNASERGEILTRKNPYVMEELVAGMEEMETMMEEMHQKIQDFKKRRYP